MKGRSSRCPHLCSCICPTTTLGARAPTVRARRPMSPTTTWRSAEWWMRFLTARTGTIPPSSFSKTMPRMALTTWTRTVRSHLSSASTRRDRPRSPGGRPPLDRICHQQVLAGIGRAAQRGASFLPHRQHGSHHGDAFGFAADEPVRRLCTRDEQIVLRSKRSAALQSGQSQFEKRSDLRNQSEECAGRESFVAYGFLAPRCSGCRPVESCVVAGSEGRGARACSKAQRVSRGWRLIHL